MNIDSEKIIQILWSDYIGMIKEGVPVYFTFTSESLSRLFDAQEIHYTDARDLINEFANKYIDVYGEHAILIDGALKPNLSGFSAAILLVCQQVLVVEEMVKSNEYTENAYFPHLRRNISNNLSQVSQNPFSYHQFEMIWRTLSKEIYSVNNNSNCVTFTFASASGSTKAKRFPMGQALFTKEDVVRLIDSIGQTNLKTDNDERIFSLIRSNRSVLSKRGKQLTKPRWMRHPLVNQIRALSKSIGELNKIRNVIKKESKKLEKLYLKVYLDSSDWLSSEYVINIFDENTDIINEPSIVNLFFSRSVSNRQYHVLVPHEDGDCWVVSNEEYYPSAGDDLIVIYEKDSFSSVSGLVSSLFAIPNDDLYENSFTRAISYCYFRFAVSSEFDRSVYIQNGSICQSPEGAEQQRPEFVGGVTVNIRKTRYSNFHLPESVKIKDKEYDLSGRVKIDGVYHLFEKFSDQIKHNKYDEDYEIEFEDGAKAKLSVAPRYKIPTSEVGFTVFKRKIMPVSTLEKNLDMAVRRNMHILPPHETYKILNERLGDGKLDKIYELLNDMQNTACRH